MSYQPMNGVKNFMSLYTQKPNMYILNKVLECFDIKDISNHRIISKIHIDITGLLKKMTNIIPELSLYYHLRLINFYFYENHITFNRCISILRNILYQLDFVLLRTESVMLKKKVIQYRIADRNNHYEYSKKIVIDNKPRLCVFD